MRYSGSSSFLVVTAQTLILQPKLHNRLLVEDYSVFGTFSPTTEISGYSQGTRAVPVGRLAQETHPDPGDTVTPVCQSSIP